MRSYYIDNFNKQVVLSFNKSDKAIIEDLKLVSFRIRYNPVLKIWIIPVDLWCKPRIAPFLKKWKFKHKPLEKQAIEKFDYSLKEKLSLKLKNFFLDKNFSYIPRDYQIESLGYGLEKGSIINGDDVGIGKTFESIMYAEYTNSFPCLVICPASVKYNWAEKWSEIVGNERTISVIESRETKKNPRNWNTDVVIINFDIVGKKQGKGATANFPELLSKKWKMFIIDEAHFLKEKTSQRFKAVKMITKKSEAIIQLLTGTVSMSKPSEIWNLLVILKKDYLIADSWEDYIQRYCNGFKDKYSWNCSGAFNLIGLNKILRENFYLRREKKDVLKELPIAIKTVLKSKISNSKEIEEAKDDLLSYLLEKNGEESMESAMQAQALVLLSVLRKLSIEGKMKAIEEYLKDWKSSGQKLLVFGIHREPLEYLSKKFNSPLLAGGVSAIKKQSILKEWMSNDEIFLFANQGTAGTGVDGLQSVCSNMLIIELPWRPSDLQQVEARLDRLGQTEPPNINYLLSDETIDKQMWKMLVNKEIATSALNQGIDLENEDSGMKIVAKMLLEENSKNN